MAKELKFRLSLVQVLMEKHGSGTPHPVHSCSSIGPPPKRHAQQNFLKRLPATRKKAELQRKYLVCTKHENILV
jgi:hypothetical protein